MRVARRVLAVLLSGCAFGGAVGGQTLELARQEVRERDPAPASEPAPAPAKTPPPRKASSTSTPSGDDPGYTFGDATGLVALTGAVLSAPVWGPAVLLGDSYRAPGFFPPHPYQESAGNLVIADEPYKPLRPWSAQVSFVYGNDFDGLARYGGQALVSTTQRVDFDTEWNWYVENQPGGADSIHTGDANMMFRCAQSERVQMRIGLGLNWLVDQRDQDVGVNFTYGAQVFPIKPVVLTTELDWGTLGNAPLFHVRATAGAVFRGCELFAGYDFRKIGQADLQGPMLGLRYHFYGTALSAVSRTRAQPLGRAARRKPADPPWLTIRR